MEPVTTRIPGAPEGAALRFGIGLTLLAEEQCEGFRRGPMFNRMMKILDAGSKSSKKPFDKEAFLARTRQEASAKLSELGKGVCEAAATGARPGGIIERSGT